MGGWVASDTGRSGGRAAFSAASGRPSGRGLQEAPHRSRRGGDWAADRWLVLLAVGQRGSEAAPGQKTGALLVGVPRPAAPLSDCVLLTFQHLSATCWAGGAAARAVCGARRQRARRPIRAHGRRHGGFAGAAAQARAGGNSTCVMTAGSRGGCVCRLLFERMADGREDSLQGAVGRQCAHGHGQAGGRYPCGC